MREIEGEKVPSTSVVLRRTIRTKYRFVFFTIPMTYFGVDIGTDDEVGVPWDLLENRGECLEELFMGGIVAGMVDRCKKEGE